MGLISADEELTDKSDREVDRLLKDYEHAAPEDPVSELPTEDLPPTIREG